MHQNLWECFFQKDYPHASFTLEGTVLIPLFLSYWTILISLPYHTHKGQSLSLFHILPLCWHQTIFIPPSYSSVSFSSLFRITFIPHPRDQPFWCFFHTQKSHPNPFSTVLKESSIASFHGPNRSSSCLFYTYKEPSSSLFHTLKRPLSLLYHLFSKGTSSWPLFLYGSSRGHTHLLRDKNTCTPWYTDACTYVHTQLHTHTLIYIHKYTVYFCKQINIMLNRY